MFPLCHLFSPRHRPPPEQAEYLWICQLSLPHSRVPPALGSLHHSPSQGFSALRSSGQSSQVICETTATEAIISYCGHQEPASQGLCCLWTWTDWMRLQTSLRPQASPLSSREGSNSPRVFRASLVLGGPSQDGQPGLSLHQCRLKYCRSGWGQFEGQRMAWCARSFISGAHYGEGWLR